MQADNPVFLFIPDKGAWLKPPESLHVQKKERSIVIICLGSVAQLVRLWSLHAPLGLWLSVSTTRVGVVGPTRARLLGCFTK